MLPAVALLVTLVGLVVPGGLAFSHALPAPLAIASAGHRGGLGIPAPPQLPSARSNLASSNLVPALRALGPPTNPIWKNVTTSPTIIGPGQRYGAAMAYDVNDGYSVLFGGGTTGKPYLNDTWEWKNNAWVNVSTSSGGHITGAPTGRLFPVMTYDSVAKEIILWGGLYKGAATSYYVNDTWTFAGGVWTNITSSAGNAPAGRFAASMQYDPKSDTVVLFGGGYGGLPAGTSSKAQQETWTFHSGVWHNNTTALGAAQPPARDEASMAWYGNESAIVLFGGQGYKNHLMNDTWIWKKGAWTNVTTYGPVHPIGTPFGSGYGIRGAVLVPDETDGVLMLYGGSDITGPGFAEANNYTYIFYHNNWTDVHGWVGTPAVINGTYAPSADWDNSTHRVLYCCGFEVYTLFTQGPSNSTWEYRWHNVSTVLTANRSQVPLGQSIIFTSTTHGGSWNYSWKYLGLPPGCTTVNAASWTCTPTSAGQVNMTVFGNDSNGISSQSNLSFLVFQPLSPTLAVEPTNIDLGTALYVNTSVSGGSAGSHTFTFSGLPSGCASINSGAWSCTPRLNGTFHISVSVKDSNNDIAGSGPITVVVHPKLTVTLVRSLRILEGGQTVWFNSTPGGGDSNYTYAWSNLPTGCASSNLQDLSCTPSATAQGAFSPTVALSDGTIQSANGNHPTTKTANTSVTVWPALGASINVTPLTGHAPLAVNLNSIVTGGDPPTLTTWILYSTVQSSQQNWSHTFTTQGTYAVQFWANDTLGVSIYRSASVVVGAPVPPLTANISVAPVGGRVDVGNTAVFTAYAAGGLPGPSGYSYYWTPETGCTASGANFTCVPVRPGTLFATVQVNDSSGRTQTKTGQVIVSPRLGVTIGQSASATCGPVTVNLTATPTGGLRPYTVNWTFSGGTTGTGTTAQQYYASVGTYPVSATVTDGTGASNSTSVSVVVTKCSSQGPSTSNAFPTTLVIAALIAVVAVVAVVALLLRRRGGTPPEYAESEGEPPADEEGEAPAEGAEGEMIYGADRAPSTDSFAVGPTQESWPPGETTPAEGEENPPE